MHVALRILPIFIVILLGYILKRTAFASPEFADELNRLVYYIGLPALLFSVTSNLDTAELVGTTTALAYPIVVIVTASIALAATLLLPYTQRGPVTQASFRADVGYLGLATVTALLGTDALPHAAILIGAGAVMNTLLSITVLSALQPGGGQLFSVKRVVGIFTNPLLLAIALGFLFSMSGRQLPHLLNQPVQLLGQMSLPLILLVLGSSVSFSELNRNLLAASLASLLKLVVMPIVAWLLMQLVLPTSKLAVNTTVIMTAMPSAAASQAFAKAFGADESVSASSVGLSTLLALVSIPIVALFLGI